MLLRLAALILLAAPVCNIPVFRYALERWSAGTYEVVVFHRGAPGEDLRAGLDVLRQSGANIVVDRVDVAGSLNARERKIFEGEKSPAQPWMVLLYPETDTVAWSGPFSVDTARRAVDSPARRQIARRLMAGDSTVWLLLESGDKARDDAAAALLDKELRTLEKTLKLPVRGPEDPPILSEIPMRISFSTLRISRADPAEQAFVEMLTRSDTDLKGPVLFPIFGRGRALWAMAGEGLNPAMIGEAGVFLTSPCSCEAKELNPGLDLLVVADWEAGLSLSAPPPSEPVPVPVIGGGAPPAEAPPAAPPAPASAPASGARPVLWMAIAGAALLVVATGLRLLRRS